MDEYGPQFGINISLPFPIAISALIETIDGLMTDGEDPALQDDIILTNITINELMYQVRKFDIFLQNVSILLIF